MRQTVKLALVTGVVAIIVVGTASIVTIEKKSGSSNKASAHTDVGLNETANNQEQAGDTIPSRQTRISTDQPSPAFKPGTKFAPEGLTVADNTFVFDSRRVDVNGDGFVDDVVLIGEKQDNNNPYVQNISVSVKDGHTGKVSTASIGELNVGLEPKFFIGSFSSAKYNDILVSFATGGSGGVYQYALLTDQDGQAVSTVPQKKLNEGLPLETQCFSGFVLKVTDRNTGYIATIDLKKGSTDYQRLGIYNEKGELLQDPMILIDGFGVLKPELNGVGIYELHGIQRISVGAHANSVANAESVWSVSNGQLKLLNENIKALN
ncbi:conserved exported hypothetical protein [Candidatus Desulfosporosinus infrequens]|uniref:Uncharacterized protein n=1 Tax=Candidatus Desulfosporosinus infrequens TaxID=2043169 RepID=A0A2U3LUT1_9FIRM|nr:conserved exported hypothetical protein [Candidatus Desulfosporosinus infrequens]